MTAVAEPMNLEQQNQLWHPVLLHPTQIQQSLYHQLDPGAVHTQQLERQKHYPRPVRLALVTHQSFSIR